MRTEAMITAWGRHGGGDRSWVAAAGCGQMFGSNRSGWIAVLENAVADFRCGGRPETRTGGDPMQFTTRAARRGLAAVAITCAAVLVPTAALAASGGRAAAARPATVNQPPPAVAPRCATGALTVWLGIPGDGAAGSISYQLELSNTSARACPPYGLPGVPAVG